VVVWKLPGSYGAIVLRPWTAPATLGVLDWTAYATICAIGSRIVEISWGERDMYPRTRGVCFSGGENVLGDHPAVAEAARLGWGRPAAGGEASAVVSYAARARTARNGPDSLPSVAGSDIIQGAEKQCVRRTLPRKPQGRSPETRAKGSPSSRQDNNLSTVSQ